MVAVRDRVILNGDRFRGAGEVIEVGHNLVRVHAANGKKYRYTDGDISKVIAFPARDSRVRVNGDRFNGDATVIETGPNLIRVRGTNGKKYRYTDADLVKVVSATAAAAVAQSAPASQFSGVEVTVYNNGSVVSTHRHSL